MGSNALSAIFHDLHWPAFSFCGGTAISMAACAYSGSVVIVGGLSYLNSSVYEFADKDGVHFRRYISIRFVPWTKIGRVSWFGKNILSIHLRAGNLLRREMNANLSSSRSIFLNVEGEPELMRWLLVAKPSTADGLELRPWGTDTVASRKMQAVLKILIPVISAAILIWLLITAHSAHG